MRTHLFTLLFLFIGIAGLQAQDNGQDTVKHWKMGGVNSLTFSQVSFTNWASGGENSYTLNGLINLHANYKEGRNSWENSLDLGYGVVKQASRGVRKSDDRWIRIDQKKAMQIVFIILGTIAAILPATVHNYAAERQFIPISSNAGVNLYIGNNPQSSPFYEVPPDINMSGDMMGKAAATRAAGKELGSSEISGYWKNRALTWIRSDPFHFLKLFASRIYHFWGWGEPEQVYSMKEMSGLIPGLKWPLFHYGVLSPLALTGVILGLIRARRRKILPSLFIFSWMFSLAPFFITARYRIPIIPVMSIPAGFVCITVYQQIRGKKFKRAGIIFGTIVIFFFLLNNTRYLDNRQSGEAFHNSLGLIYKEKGDIDKALEEFRKAAEIGKAPQIYANMGDCLYLKRTFSEALEYYRKSEKSSPDNPMIYFKMGQCYLEMNNQKKAFGMFRKAVRIDPEVHPLAWYNLTFLYMTGGNPEKAAECFKVYRRMRPEDLEAVQTYRRFMEKFSK